MIASFHQALQLNTTGGRVVSIHRYAAPQQQQQQPNQKQNSFSFLYPLKRLIQSD
jgi:hypothetical protein